MPFYKDNGKGQPDYSQGQMLNKNEPSGHVIEGKERDFDAWLHDQQVSHSAPKWTDLVEEFSYPGNLLYSSVVLKVAAAGWQTVDHWNNLKLVLFQTFDLMKLSAGLQFLAQLLETNGHPLSKEDVIAWNALIEKHGFPENCRLKEPEDAVA